MMNEKKKYAGILVAALAVFFISLGLGGYFGRQVTAAEAPKRDKASVSMRTLRHDELHALSEEERLAYCRWLADETSKIALTWLNGIPKGHLNKFNIRKLNAAELKTLTEKDLEYYHHWLSEVEAEMLWEAEFRKKWERKNEAGKSE
jgi:hypothetical protein